MSDAATARATPELLDRVPVWAAPAGLLTAAGAGLALVDRPVGLGLTLTAWAVFSIVVRAVAPRDRWAQTTWAAAAALAALATVRAAGWIQVLSLLGSLGLAAVAAFGSRRWRDFGAAVGWWAVALVPGPVMLVGPLVRRRWDRALPVVRGAVLAAPLLLVFGALFAAADAAFAELLDDAGATVADVDAPRIAVALLVAAVAGALLWTAVAPQPRAASEPRRPLGPTEWTVALVALDGLFALFVALQLPVLFGGHEHVLVTPDLSYADYAHQGFGQLLVVAGLALAVVAAAVRWCRRSDDRLLRVLLGVLCVLCLVVLASAWQRLGVYVEAFGHSRLRLLAQWGIAWVGGVLVLVLAAGARGGSAAWLPRAVVSATAAAWLLFALANPDARIAERNLLRAEVDRAYLATLSEDAAGVLGRDCRERGGGVLSFNVGRARC